MGLADFLVPGRPQSYINDLDPEFSGALERFIGANPGVTIYSGARSVERQSQLWNDALKKYGSPEAARKWVAPPGHSFHNKGQAADLRYSSDEVRALAHKSAADYGLNFPLSNENWHIEPIGARSGRPPPMGSEAPAGPSPPMPTAGASFPDDMMAMFRDSLQARAGMPQPDQNPMVRQSHDLFSGRYGGGDLAQDLLSGTNPLRRAVLSRLAQVL